MPEPTRPAGLEPSAPKGAMNVAAVLLALGPEAAAPVLEGMREGEMRLIARGASALRSAPPESVDAVLRDFVAAMEGAESELASADSVLRQLLASTFGEDAVRRVFEDEVPSGGPLEQRVLRDVEPQELALLLSRENLQTRALILGVLEASHAAAVIEHMPEETRALLISRLGRIDSVSPEILDELVGAIAGEARSVATRRRLQVDGQLQAVEVLKRLPPTARNEAMAELEREDPELAFKIRGQLFAFDDFNKLSDRDIQALLKEVDTKNLVVALKGTSVDVRDKLLGNVSERVRLMILDDLEVMGPVRLSAVEQAQADLIKIALSLAEEGKITIPDGSDELV